MKKIIIYFLCLPLLGACTMHRLDIQQGNVVTSDMVEKLKTGMSKRQVVFVMGTPLLQDPFHQRRWDYYYSYKPQGKPGPRHGVTLWFDGDTLSRIESYGTIPDQEPLEVERINRESF